MTHFLHEPRPVRQVRLFDMDEFKSLGKPGPLARAIRKFNAHTLHKADRKFKVPHPGLKIVKSSDVHVTASKLPYSK